MIENLNNTGQTFSLIVSSDSDPCRIDLYITRAIQRYSRSYFQGIINQGNVTLNGIVTRKTSIIVCPNDSIVVHVPLKKSAEPQAIIDKTIGVSVIAETEHFVMIHKPAPLLVHPPSLTSKSITLSDWVRHYYSHIAHVGTIDRPGIIHRLDRDTSGIMVITKTPYAHNIFGLLFRERNITKTYKAVVHGHPEKEGYIDFALGRDPINRVRMAYFDADLMDSEKKIGAIKVRHAETYYKVLEYFEDAALIEVTPKTGRTHQIRLHMAAIGHPIVGDSMYGKKSMHIDRQALHAERLSFVFDDVSYSFTDPLPDDFNALLTILRTSKSPIQYE